MRCLLYIVENQVVNKLGGDFDDYRKELLEELGEDIIHNPSAAANVAVQQQAKENFINYIIIILLFDHLSSFN